MVRFNKKTMISDKEISIMKLRYHDVEIFKSLKIKNECYSELKLCDW